MHTEPVKLIADWAIQLMVVVGGVWFLYCWFLFRHRYRCKNCGSWNTYRSYSLRHPEESEGIIIETTHVTCLDCLARRNLRVKTVRDK